MFAAKAVSKIIKEVPMDHKLFEGSIGGGIVIIRYDGSIGG